MTKGRIVLQDLDDARYLAADGAWVVNAREARQFEHTWSALLEGLSHRGKQLQVIWSLPGPAEDIRIPVRPAGPATTLPLSVQNDLSARLPNRSTSVRAE